MRTRDREQRYDSGPPPREPFALSLAGAEQCLMGARQLRGVCVRYGDPARPDHKTPHGRFHQKLLRHRVDQRRLWAKALHKAGHGMTAEEAEYLLDDTEAGLVGERLPDEVVSSPPASVNIGDAVAGIAKGIPGGTGG